MTSKYFGLILALLAAACTAKTLDGGSNDRDAAAPKDEDGGSGEAGGPTATREGGVGARTAGQSCDEANGCVEGLACSDIAEHPTGQPCRVIGQQCTKTCVAGAEGDAICHTLGPKYVCFAGCGSDYSCGNTL